MRTRRGILTALIAAFAWTSAFGAQGDIVFTPPNVAPIIFSHEHHTKDYGVTCMACHFDRFSAGTGGYKVNKKRLNKREFCGHCHNGMKGFDQDSSSNCVRCHKK